MAHPGPSQCPSQPLPPPSTTGNPVMAVGRKVKSIFSSHQRPSIRILRNTSEPGLVPATQDFAEKPLPPLPSRGNAHGSESSAEYAANDVAPGELALPLSRQNTFASRFAGARNRAGSIVQSIFGRGENSGQDDKPFENENEYDTSTVDLLDVMGMYTKPRLQSIY
jgi:hypothetical protein